MISFKDFPVPVIQPLLLEDVQPGKRLWIVRGDLIHPQVSGNKWFKLKYNMLSAAEEGADVLSFGGPWSNHIYALAAAGQQLNINTIGVIRGAWRKELTPMLKNAVDWGMQLIFVDKTSYQKRNDSQWIAEQWPLWRNQLLSNKADSSGRYTTTIFARDTKNRQDTIKQTAEWLYEPGLSSERVFIVPEGGSNVLGMMGVGEWAKSVFGQFNQATAFFLPVGSGGTLAGFANISSKHKIIGVPVLRTGECLDLEINELLRECAERDSRKPTQWQLASDYHWGGYARYPAALRDFQLNIEKETGIQFDPVYTSKTIYAMLEMLARGVVTTQDVVMVHTGGLQGRRGITM